MAKVRGKLQFRRWEVSANHTMLSPFSNLYMQETNGLPDLAVRLPVNLDNYSNFGTVVLHENI